VARPRLKTWRGVEDDAHSVSAVGGLTEMIYGATASCVAGGTECGLGDRSHHLSYRVRHSELHVFAPVSSCACLMPRENGRRHTKH
jgi:hypothetical protein